MLSILVPTYNFDVRNLVFSLDLQCKGTNLPYEIMVMDDASSEEFKNLNRELKGIPSVWYEELDNNHGRSKIRNVMASKATYNYLLFLDCDAEIPERFIRNYLDLKLQGEMVVCGGRIYQNQIPADKRLRLHWKYGVQKESMDATKRKKKGYRSFMTNNFLIAKSVFEKLKFEENITTYGHEDTLFGIQLERMKIPIKHIENPVTHAGLEYHEVFLKKTEAAIRNLIMIENTDGVKHMVTLLKWYGLVKKFKLEIPIHRLFQLCITRMTKSLRSGNPSLTVFSMYKLGYLVSLKMSNEF